MITCNARGGWAKNKNKEILYKEQPNPTHEGSSMVKVKSSRQFLHGFKNF